MRLARTGALLCLGVLGYEEPRPAERPAGLTSPSANPLPASRQNTDGPGPQGTGAVLCPGAPSSGSRPSVFGDKEDGEQGIWSGSLPLTVATPVVVVPSKDRLPQHTPLGSRPFCVYDALRAVLSHANTRSAIVLYQ